MINTSVDINDKPSAFRYPRGNGVGVNLPSNDEKIIISLRDPNSSMLIEKKDNQHFKYVVMPMRI